MDQHSTQEAKCCINTKQPQTQNFSNPQPIKEAVTPDLTTVETSQDITPKPQTANRHEALLKMQKMDPIL